MNSVCVGGWVDVDLCVCVGVDLLDIWLRELTSLRRCYIDIFAFQQLSCNWERDALSRDIRKANQPAWFYQNPPYETTAS